MKMMYLLPLAFIALALSGCGRQDDSAEQARTLQSENASLRKELADAKRELDDLKHGPARLLAQAEAAVAKAEWQTAKASAEDLLLRYPSSPEAAGAKLVIAATSAAIAKAAKEAKLEEARRQEAERLQRVQEERRLSVALSKMRKKVDSIENVTWYHDQTSPRYANYNGFFLYIGKRPTGSPWLRLRIQYNASDWLFIESFIVVADGVRFEYPRVEFERDNDSEIWEWYDEPASASDLGMVNAVINSKSAVIRFNGRQYRRDRTVTAAEKAALRNVLDAYKVLGGT